MTRNNNILVVIPRGEVIRNFAYSGIIEQLRRTTRVHLLSIIPNEEIKTYLSGISDDFAELVDIPLSYKHNYLIGLLDLAHNRYLWSEAAKVRWNMRDVEANTLGKRLKRALNKIIARSFSNNTSLKFLENQLLKQSAHEEAVQYYLKRLKKIKPDLVFNGSHSHAKNAYPVIQAARLLGIKTCAFLFSWDNLTSQGRVIPSYDYYLAWNEQIKQDFLRIYPDYSPEQIFVTGTPQFSFHFDPSNHIERTEFLQQLGIPSDQKYVLYSSGMSHHMPYEPEVAEGIADMLPGIDPKLRLVVRTYAKDKDRVFDHLKKKRKDIIIPEVEWETNYQTPLLKDQLFFTNLLKHCELGINVASTISLELCMFDKPVINVGYDPPGRNIFPYSYTRFYNFDHYKPVIQSGAVQLAKNDQEMAHFIKESIRNPTKYSEQRKQLINKFFDEGLYDTTGIELIESLNNILKKV